MIIAGHGRVAAAELAGMSGVPTIRLSHLNAAERGAYVLVDNKLAQNAGWTTELLAIEMQSLIEMDFDLSLTGFESVEIDQVLDDWAEASLTVGDATVDLVPEVREHVVTKPGDIWKLGMHLLPRGDARSSDDLGNLSRDEKVDIIFTDACFLLTCVRLSIYDIRPSEGSTYNSLPEMQL
jgi:ParB-like chromosome segregation protein Spo0J